jgi:hypothetical protein
MLGKQAYVLGNGQPLGYVDEIILDMVDAAFYGLCTIYRYVHG